jgi:hypothetical protein
VATLGELQARRAFECRLTPDRALATIDDAEAFLRDRGMLTRSPDCALPSLHEACHEEPYRAGAGGFGDWPATRYRWGFELGARAGVYALKIHRGKTLFLTAETAALADPILRAEADRMAAADPGWARLLAHLGNAGPSLLEDVRVELELKPKELKSLRSPLERCGAVVGRSVVLEPHTHTSELARWDQVFPATGGKPDLAPLLISGVRAAVVAPERELGRWFSWSWRFEPGLLGRLVGEGRLVRPEPGWVAVP